MTHSISDLIIRIKNGYMAKREFVEIPLSRFKKQVLEKLKKIGFIEDFYEEGSLKKKLLVKLLYSRGKAALTNVKILSKPGRRYYVSYKDLKPVLNGLGYSILSTSKGILTNVEARKEKIGGELLFEIW